jgi:hypothetical protein
MSEFDSVTFLPLPRSPSNLKTYLLAQSQRCFGPKTFGIHEPFFTLSIVPLPHLSLKFPACKDLYLKCYHPLRSSFVEAFPFPPSHLRSAFRPYGYAVFVYSYKINARVGSESRQLEHNVYWQRESAVRLVKSITPVLL